MRDGADPMESGFVGPDSPAWERVLAGAEHDFYHLPGYVRLCARQERGEPVAFVAEQGGRRLLIPLILRPIDPALGGAEGGSFDAVSPYGYPGPLLGPAVGPGDEVFLRRALAEFLAGLKGLRVVAAYVRLHPLFPLPEGPLGEVGTLVAHGETVSVDLTLPPEEIWRQTRHGHRHEINKAAREGQVARIDDGRFEEFFEIYTESMDRVGAGGYYYFPRDYFADLRAVLGDRLHLAVVEVDGRVACAGLFTEVCGIVQYHLSGTRAAFLKHRPSKLMLHFLRQWAQGRGDRVLHLGGGVGGRKDALFEFKAGFSQVRHPFSSWRIVVDRSAYGDLVRRWESLRGIDADGIEGFFPAYRKPH
jgi:hypothetical protein